MIRADVIRMAGDAGFGPVFTQVHLDALTRLVDLAQAAERKACIDIVHRRTGIPEDALRRGTGVRDQLVIAGEDIMRSIHARAEPKGAC